MRSSEPQVYLPYRQVADGEWQWFAPKDLVVRTDGDPLALVPSVRAIVQRADPSQPVSDIRTLADVVGAENVPRLVQLRVIAAFGLVAFVLAGIGLHGVLACAVASRTLEIAIRVALGARRTDIVAMVIGRSLVLTGIGIAAGVGIALVSARSLESMLAGVGVVDMLTIAAVCALVLAMTAAVSIRPIVRAARVDPSAVVRQT